jgi:Predicted glycosyltransferases
MQVVFLENPPVSIVLPTYNRPGILRECLLSVIAQTYQDWELVIIDDCSPLPVESTIKDLLDRDSRIKFVRNLFRRTTPSSKNIGISLARHDLVLFLEDDMVLDPSSIRILIDTYLTLSRSDTMLGAVAPSIPRVYPEDLKNLNSVKDRLVNERPSTGSTPQRTSPWTGQIDIDFTPKYRDVQEVGDVHACVIYLKKALIDAGGFRENTYKGNFSREESDLSWRVHRLGYHYYFQPAAIFYHVRVSEGGSRVSYLQFVYYTIANHTKFLYHNRGLVRTLYMAPLFALWSLKGGVVRLMKLLPTLFAGRSKS